MPAIGSGSLFFPPVTHAGFWLINRCFGMSVVDTIETRSIIETIMSVTGLVLVLPASLVV